MENLGQFSAEINNMGYGWFSRGVLWRVVDELPEPQRYDILSDERGFAIEPHSRQEISISTQDVRRYLGETLATDRALAPPRELFPTSAGDGHRYSAILYIEKTGFRELCE